MRKAEELSTTVAPARTASGAKRREVLLPAENSAMSTPRKLVSVSSRTGSALLRNVSALPAERTEANSRSSDSGKRRCSRQRISSRPTAPVAPTIATTGRETEGSADIAVISRYTNEEAPSSWRRGLWIRRLFDVLQRAAAS